MPLSASQKTKRSKKAGKNGRPSLAANAYAIIYRNIVSLVYEPGQRLEENQLVEQLGIGRTPIREALFRLAAEKLVEVVRGRGFFVRDITLRDTRDLFEAMKQVAETGKGPQEQIPSMGCSIKWKGETA